jgi:hypothetical protein
MYISIFKVSHITKMYADEQGKLMSENIFLVKNAN